MRTIYLLFSNVYLYTYIGRYLKRISWLIILFLLDTRIQDTYTTFIKYIMITNSTVIYNSSGLVLSTVLYAYMVIIIK